jgi:hypothetical protein
MLMLRLSLALSGLIALAAATSGCIVHGRVGARVEAQPAMVEVSPGVMVIEDYDEPVFYSDGYYWLYSDGVWLRSSYHTGGWVRVRTVPTRIVSIRSPRAYVRYRGGARVHGRGGAVYRRGPGPVQRDRRDTRVRDDRHRHHH